MKYNLIMPRKFNLDGNMQLIMEIYKKKKIQFQIMYRDMYPILKWKLLIISGKR